MGKRKGKPSDPDAILAAKRARAAASDRAYMVSQGIDPEIAAWGDEPVSKARVADLKAKHVVVKLDSARRVLGAHRADVWESLHSRDGLTDEQLKAVRDLQDDMTFRAGLAGRDEVFDDVTVDSAGDACAVTQRMLNAGERVDLTLLLIGPPCANILKALIEPAVYGTPVDDWRAVVARESREARPEAQSALLRMCAQALIMAAPAVDAELERRRKAKGKRHPKCAETQFAINHAR